MTTHARKPRQKRETSAPILAAVILLTVLTVLGSVSFYLLGRPLPQEAASLSPPLAWGDRAERRMDAFIDRIRPKWTDRVEKRMEPLADKAGWK